MSGVSLAVNESSKLARPLKVLVPLIKSELNEAREAGIEHYRKVGEMLQEAKYQVKEKGGSWQQWLIQNFEMSSSTALSYMNLAGELEFREAKAEAESNQSNSDSWRAKSPKVNDIKRLSDFTHPGRDSGHRPAWFGPVQEATSRFDVGKIRRESELKAKADKVCRALAIQIIDIGYKVLATKIHPDKGGSAEAMSRLNEVRKSLKQFTEATWNR